MAANVVHNSLREVAHIVKFNGENHHEWNYEVLSMLEQLGLKNLIVISNWRATLNSPSTGKVHSQTLLDQTCLISHRKLI